MKADVIKLSLGIKPSKGVSKETLNHPGLVRLASGLDPMKHTAEAYLKAYDSLGIDIINRVPEQNAPEPMKPGETQMMENGYSRSYLGLYDSWTRNKYPFDDVDDFFQSSDIDLQYDKLITPVPHRLDKETINRKMQLAGEIGLYYYMYYTTLFMWGVEYLGWEIFMQAATIDPEGFKERFLDRAFQRSKEAIELLSGIDTPFVFVHDDLADARGPVFSPGWYEKYIFPEYIKLFGPVKRAGKKIIFTADGNMEHFLEDLKHCGVDGVMLESPATSFDKIIRSFENGIMIGGIETSKLTFGNEQEIKEHVRLVHKKTENINGFAMSSAGGIHGNIPIDNLAAYFDARAELGYTKPDWRKNR